MIQHRLDTCIRRSLLAGDVHDGATITVDITNGELAVTWADPPDEQHINDSEVA
jgi:ATP-dependent Clp protease ATP-binding subunit ClpB